MQENSHRVIARLLQSGTCPSCSNDRPLELNGMTPTGVCDIAYAVLSRDARGLSCGADMPGLGDEDRLLIHCPEPCGAIWELRRVQRQEPGTGGGSGAAASRPEAVELCNISVCKGNARNCPNALLDTDGLVESIREVLRSTGVAEHIRETTHGRILSHHRLNVAVAACPNSCSKPQIKDIGIVAQAVPRVSDDEELCTGCGLCVESCREGAVRVDDLSPAIDRGACVDCGSCAMACPTGAVAAVEMGWRLLVGGRLGRHPRLAEVLLPLGTEAEVLRALQICLELFVSSGREDERFADFVFRVGLDALARA